MNGVLNRYIIFLLHFSPHDSPSQAAHGSALLRGSARAQTAYSKKTLRVFANAVPNSVNRNDALVKKQPKVYNEPMYFDTHAHYAAPEYAPFLEALLAGLARAGISDILLVSTDLQSAERSCMIADTFSPRVPSAAENTAAEPNQNAPLPRLYPAVGIHPLFAGDAPEDAAEALRRLILRYPVAAIGEFGLDYYEEKHRNKPADHGLQRRFFLEQLKLCEEFSLPALIHSRAAHQETFDLLAEHPRVKGILHGYSGSAELAMRYADSGWLIGIGAAVCRPDARRIKEVVRRVPAECLAAETDCPFQSIPGAERVIPSLPDSLQLIEIVSAIAALKGLSEKKISAMLCHSCSLMIRKHQ